MSQHPKTASVRLKVGLVILLSVVATVVLVGYGLRDETARDADHTRDLATVVAASADLVQALQDERAAVAKAVPTTAGSDQERQYRAAFDSAASAVDGATAEYRRLAVLDNRPSGVATVLGRIDDGLRRLPDVRAGSTGNRLGLTNATGAYTTLVANLLGLRDDLAAQITRPDLGQRMRAAAAIARHKEHLSQERLVMLRSLAAGAMYPNFQDQFVAARTGRLQALETFSSLATPTERRQFDEAVAGAPQRPATTFEDWVVGAMPDEGDLTAAPFTVDTWDEALLAEGRLIRGIEQRFDTAVVDTATAMRDDRRRALLVRTGVPIAILLVALLAAWLVGRSITRRRDPRDGADLPGGPADPDRPLATTGPTNGTNGRG